MGISIGIYRDAHAHTHIYIGDSFARSYSIGMDRCGGDNDDDNDDSSDDATLNKKKVIINSVQCNARNSRIFKIFFFHFYIKLSTLSID